MNDVSVERLEDRGAFLLEWRELFQRSDAQSIFLSPAWIECWLEGAPLDAALWAIKGIAAGKTALLGVAGATGERRPALIGPISAHLHELGDPDRDAIYIEYNDFLVAADAPEVLREQALAALAAAIGAVDELVLRNARAPLVRAAEAFAAARGSGVRVLKSQPTFTIDLKGIRASGGDFLGARSATLRSQVKRTIRLYEQRGAIAIKPANTPEERAEAWKSLISLHEESWRRRGLKGAFANPALLDFHARLMRSAPDAIHFVRLYSGDEIIACLYNLVRGDRVYNYQGGFKFEENNQLKPGMLAHSIAAQRYIENGYAVYDLLAGDAPYKRRLADEGETLVSLAIELGSGPRAGIRRGVRRLREAASQRAGTRRT